MGFPGNLPPLVARLVDLTRCSLPAYRLIPQHLSPYAASAAQRDVGNGKWRVGWADGDFCEAPERKRTAGGGPLRSYRS